MPPTATKQPNNNVVDASDSSECGLRLPGEQDIVKIWPNTCLQQSCGTDLFQATSTKLDARLPSSVKGYHVDFRGFDYNTKHPKKNLRSELQWTPHEHVDDGVMLKMHDPVKLKADDGFPYVFCTYNYKNKFIPCAIEATEANMQDKRFSTVFKIKCVPWGQSTWLFMINDYSKVENLADDSPYYIGRSPGGDVILTKTDRPPYYNPLSYMLISDRGSV